MLDLQNHQKNEGWKEFLALLKQKREGRLPPRIDKVSPPGYWKDRDTGRLENVRGSNLYIPLFYRHQTRLVKNADRLIAKCSEGE